MNRIGVLYHPQREESARLAGEVVDLLRPRGVEIWQGRVDDEDALRQVASTLDLLITFGGDGTIVRAQRAVSGCGVPILGVNLGRLGFLAEVEPSRLEQAVDSLFTGRYSIEERMMLRMELCRGEKVLLQAEAINDVVLARGAAARTVRVSVEVDAHHVMTPTADGVIVSTPTGSTAYCLAAGGPIVAPDVPCLTITPVAAHLGIARALVIPARRRLVLRLVKGEGAMLTVDGQIDAPVELEDRICITASENVARFIRFGGDGYFYEMVLRKLRWLDQPLEEEE